MAGAGEYQGRPFLGENNQPISGRCAPVPEATRIRVQSRSLVVRELLKRFPRTSLAPLEGFIAPLWDLHPQPREDDCSHYCYSALLNEAFAASSLLSAILPPGHRVSVLAPYFKPECFHSGFAISVFSIFPQPGQQASVIAALSFFTTDTQDADADAESIAALCCVGATCWLRGA